MKKIQRGFDMLTEEERQKTIEYIITHFKKERDENMDILGAGEILDVVLQQVTPKIYNKAVEEASIAFRKQAEELDFQLNVLKK